MSANRCISTAILENLREIVLNNSRREKFLSIGCYCILGVVSLFMTIVNIMTRKYILMVSTLLFFFLCGIDALLSGILHVPYKKVQILFQVEIVILFSFFLNSGIPEGFSALWMLILPAAGMLVFGKKIVTFTSSTLFLILLFFFYTDIGRSLLQYQYTESFMLRFPMAFLAFYFVGFFIETVRELTFAELEKLKNTQADIIADQTSELREKNFNTLRVNARLELTNRLLIENISEEKRAEILKEIEESENEERNINQ